MKDVTSTLNQGQEEAAQAVFQFLFSKEKEFAISGPAGVGKTHLMRHIMNETLPQYENAGALLNRDVTEYDIQLCATTNKAAEVLAKSTGYPVSTIHSFLKLRVTTDYQTGKKKVMPTKKWRVHSNTLVFIDEASMIDERTYKFIQEGFDGSCKIIYLGDHCQLSPVLEDISKVYRVPKPSALLTQPMRNADQPALMDICSMLRTTVETGEFNVLKEFPGVIDYLDPEEATDFVNTTFKEEGADARILAYSNNRVKEYLDHIRSLRGYPDIFVVGERLVNNAAIELGKEMLRVEQELEVVEVDPTIRTFKVDPKDDNSGMDYYTIKADLGDQHIVSLRIPHSKARMQQLVKHYSKQKDWVKMYSILDHYPDLRPRDASTVHKSQGSSYGTVFLDLTNIGKCTDADQLARMLYVGVSRARHRLFLFGGLPDRLFK